MNYEFILNLVLIGVIIWREISNARERQDLILQLKSRTASEFVEAKKELEEGPREPTEEERAVPLGEMDTDEFQKAVKKEINSS